MKHIQKRNEPKELKRWFNNQPIVDGIRLNCGYYDMPSDLKKIVKKQLLTEQGYLCCYTGIRINEETSHIEHLKPYSLCRDEANNEDVDYNNLLAAHPSDKAAKCSFGAHIKENWYDPDNLVSPLKGTCENRFKFDLQGRISSSNNDIPAEETIKYLKLDHSNLTELRQKAIDELLFADPISLSQAERILEKINERDKSGRFRAFCFVLYQACTIYIKKNKQRQAKNKAIKRKKS